MKILYITTISGTMVFFKDLIKNLIYDGHTVDIACSNTEGEIVSFYKKMGSQAFEISCSRIPHDIGNIKCIKEICDIVKKNKYDVVHCHTPIAAACTRVACRKLRKKGLKVIYTAHGFHFYTGAPMKNWLLYYPIEKICAHWTDVLITINKEDFERAKKKFKAKKVEYIPGVGIDTERFSKCAVDKTKKLDEIGVPEHVFLLLSVGELNENKNHQVVIRAISEINDDTIHYVIAGQGATYNKLTHLANELNVNLHLVGYRNDVEELYKISDLYILPSIREGLNVSLMEAMASGLPAICRKIRGNVDLVDSGGGVCVDEENNSREYARAILKIRNTNSKKYGQYNSQKIQQFDIKLINSKMKELYKDI